MSPRSSIPLLAKTNPLSIVGLLVLNVFKHVHKELVYYSLLIIVLLSYIYS